MQARVHRWNDITLENPIANLDRKRIMGEKVMLAMVTLHPAPGFRKAMCRFLGICPRAT